MMKHVVKLGTVSHGTLKAEDLLPAFKEEYAYYRGMAALKRLKLGRPSASYFASERAGEDLDVLFFALNTIAPAYVYFGAHEADGSDFGFWFDSEAFEEDRRSGEIVDLLLLSEDAYRGFRGVGYVVSDHGNVTVYRKTGRNTLEELVSVA